VRKKHLKLFPYKVAQYLSWEGE